MKLNKRIGETKISNEGYLMTILQYESCENITVEIGKISFKNKRYDHFKSGSIKNPYHKNNFNIGYIGVGKYLSSINSIDTKVYSTWKHMLERCYSDKLHLKYPSYINCIVCPEWHNFQVFAEWFENNYVENYHLDKDILIKGNKIYSPDTCCFVPHEINTLFTNCFNVRGNLPIGVIQNKNNYRVRISKYKKRLSLGTFKTPLDAFNIYKKEKELYIKEIADKYKSVINFKVYNSMYNYIVEITD